MKFDGRLLIIGCGSVSQCAVPLVLKFIDMPAQNITITDFVDNRSRVKDALDRGVNYVFDRVTEENYRHLLAKYVGPGDMIIDLAWNIECNAMLQWCRDRQVLYVNTSVEVWNPYEDSQRNDPTDVDFIGRRARATEDHFVQRVGRERHAHKQRASRLHCEIRRRKRARAVTCLEKRRSRAIDDENGLIHRYPMVGSKSPRQARWR